MISRFINNSLDTKIDRNFDWKTFFASSIFFFAALVNPRDFPIHNVPLIYPAFFLFVLLIGPYNVTEGFRRTKFLSFLLFTYWFYVNILSLIKARSITLGSFAYLLEPLLIFCAAGMATIRHGGTKAAFWALVSIITLSTACGIWIYFIGEPVASWRSALQGSTGGNLLQGEFIRDVDVMIDPSTVVLRNTGLSYHIFTFSYQLAVAILLTLVSLLSMRRSLSIKYLFLWGALVILFIGMLTNTERATVLSVSIGLLSFFLIKGKKILDFQIIVTFILSIFVVISLFNYSQKWEERYTLHDRPTVGEKIYIRGIVVPIAAIGSVFFEPLGAGGMSDFYKDVANRVGWFSGYGPQASHNHFANVIMYTGIVGVFLTMSLFRGLLKKIQYIRLSNLGEEVIILLVACIACIIHSLTHNAGFFKGGYETNIVFGLLWGGTAKILHPRFDNLLKKWIFEDETVV